MKAQFQMRSQEVLKTLSDLFSQYSKPDCVRSDNGSEFKAQGIQQWLKSVGVLPIYIYPGSPWENGYNERFNGTLRNEVLSTEAFYFLQEARCIIQQWVEQYDHTRTHQSLNYRPLIPETRAPTLSQTLVHTQGAWRKLPLVGRIGMRDSPVLIGE